jgi:hypothetical protein
MFAFFKILSRIIIITTLFYSIFSYASNINPYPKIFVSCTKVADNTYSCKLNAATDAAKISGYSCHGNTCIIYFAPKSKSQQEKKDAIYGYNNMPYALCSMSECTIDPKNPNMAYCNCPIVNTKNDISSISMGPKNREKSLPVYDVNNNMIKVTSNFSMTNVFGFKNKPKIDTVTLCKYNQQHIYADCFGVSCKVDKHNALNAICYCPIKRTTAFISVTGKCDAGPGKVYSAVDLKQFQLQGIYLLYNHFGRLTKKLTDQGRFCK